MYPILLSLGPISIYTAHVFAVIAWCIFSFLFWRVLRAQGVLEERIFDLTFYATLIGAVLARLGFVVLYPQLFQPSVLLIGAFWVQPGLWLYSGLLGVLLTFYYLSKRYNVRFAYVFDAFSSSLPWTLIPVSLGIFFQGVDVGRVTNVAWAFGVPGFDGRRHPVQLYEVVALFILGLVVVYLQRKSSDAKWPAGLFGALVFTLLSPVLFALEFFKDGSLYLYGITVNQWILILVFAESLGSLIIKVRLLGNIFPKRGDSHEHHAHKSDGDAGDQKASDDRSTSDN